LLGEIKAHGIAGQDYRRQPGLVNRSQYWWGTGLNWMRRPGGLHSFQGTTGNIEKGIMVLM